MAHTTEWSEPHDPTTQPQRRGGRVPGRLSCRYSAGGPPAGELHQGPGTGDLYDLRGTGEEPGRCGRNDGHRDAGQRDEQEPRGVPGPGGLADLQAGIVTAALRRVT